MSRFSNSHLAFTLIELSLVLVIIGLIVGGILVGRDLIETAKVNSQISQLAQYTAAVNAFKTKYDDLPGDIPAIKAKSLGFTYNLSTTTWNANGDGLFNSMMTPSAYLYTSTDEEYYFWPDLSKAGLIPEWLSCPGYVVCPWYAVGGAYTGVNAVYPVSVGLYFPAMKLNPNFGILPISIPAMGGNWWCLGIMNYYYAIGQTGVNAPSLTPLQAQKLDTKMDDGNPSGGIMHMLKLPGGPDSTGIYYTGFNFANDDNVSQGNYIAANCVNAGGKSYNLNTTTVACSPYIKIP